MNKFCVYFHKDSDNRVFYIGSGTKDRAYNKVVRNPSWFEKAKFGYFVEILFEGITKETSLKIEEFLILRTEDLTNKKLVNTHKISIPKEVLDCFTVDESSPSGLTRIACLNMNNAKARNMIGLPAGNKKFQTDGRPHAWQLMIGGKSYLVHRIIYTLLHGQIDDNLVVNHIDKNPFNNIPSNLRAVSTSINNSNSTVRKTKATKAPVGVYLWNPKSSNVMYWVGSHRKEGKRYRKYFSVNKLGYEEALELATEFSNSY